MYLPDSGMRAANPDVPDAMLPVVRLTVRVWPSKSAQDVCAIASLLNAQKPIKVLLLKSPRGWDVVLVAFESIRPQVICETKSKQMAETLLAPERLNPIAILPPPRSCKRTLLPPLVA